VTIFGRIITGADLERWCLETLRKWSSTYIAELEDQHELARGALPRIRTWTTTPSFDNWPEDQLPAVMLVSVGLAEPPFKQGSGEYRARWQMGLACVTSAAKLEQAHELAMLYVAAHRAVLVQRPSLEGRAAGVVWQDENYDDLPLDDLRSLSAGQAVFTVEVHEVTQANAGPLTPSEPLTPDTDPHPEWPLAETVETEVEPLPLTPTP
jgi:hypothetical protein